MKEFIAKLIGRLEEAKEISEKEMEECIFKALPYHDSTEGKVIGIKNAIEIVNKLAEEHNNGWIPCSERLPEKYIPVLVLLNNKEMCVFTLETDFEDNNIMYWEDWYGYHKKISETIAWQPLPPAYHPKGE